MEDSSGSNHKLYGTKLPILIGWKIIIVLSCRKADVDPFVKKIQSNGTILV